MEPAELAMAGLPSGVTVAWARTTGAALDAASPSVESVDACGAFMAASVTKDACTGATCVPLFASLANEAPPSIQVVDLYENFSENR
ncbi:hypothetical protein [Variovorax sp. IB41]|uniref:hypothetical protein n=1 Tax=Variovorax sp. IB41 TaxID=2779370 RepID=UPI0018E78B4C|nr:hypothetical protein [Variovorax sp. IB41]MBJ2157094.1 hypothetical protein [Variovorax sp. IB41]